MANIRHEPSRLIADSGTGGFTREMDPPHRMPTQREENYRNRLLIFYRELSFREAMGCSLLLTLSLFLSGETGIFHVPAAATPNPTFRTYLPTDAEVLTSRERSETAEIATQRITARKTKEDEDEDEDEDDDNAAERTGDRMARRTDGRTDAACETRNTQQPKLYARPRRPPETVLTNAPAYSLVSTRARHNGIMSCTQEARTRHAHTSPFATHDRGRRAADESSGCIRRRDGTSRVVGQAVEQPRLVTPASTDPIS